MIKHVLTHTKLEPASPQLLDRALQAHDSQPGRRELGRGRLPGRRACLLRVFEGREERRGRRHRAEPNESANRDDPFVAAGKVVVEGVNIAKKHQRGNPQAGVAGGIVEQAMPLDLSNVQLWNSKTNKGDRVGFKFEGEGEKRRKVRVFKSNQELVDG